MRDKLEAHNLFDKVCSRARRRRFWRALLGRPRGLACLVGEAVPPAGSRSGRHVGLTTVPLSQIRGSEGRCDGFDADFDPLEISARRRWEQMYYDATHGVVFPPVELIRVGKVYYVRDGHHRISVARALGQQQIDAEVVVWEPLAEP
jgi:hypothetical protein